VLHIWASPGEVTNLACKLNPQLNVCRVLGRAMTSTRELESPRPGYVVHEPEDGTEDASERSTSIDGSEQFRFSMADMEVYLRVLQKDRCAVRCCLLRFAFADVQRR
jgi:hypothetical protein